MTERFAIYYAPSRHQQPVGAGRDLARPRCRRRRPVRWPGGRASTAPGCSTSPSRPIAMAFTPRSRRRWRWPMAPPKPTCARRWPAFAGAARSRSSWASRALRVARWLPGAAGRRQRGAAGFCRPCGGELRRFPRARCRSRIAPRAPRRGLSERQIELLDAYGYPYVFEEFRFHMTLTDRLADSDAARYRSGGRHLVRPGARRAAWCSTG